MQAVISVPELAGRLSEQQATEMLMRPIAGVPLLLRTVLTAARAGANQILLDLSGRSKRQNSAAWFARDSF